MKMVQDHLTIFPAGGENSGINFIVQVRHLKVILTFTAHPVRHRFLLSNLHSDLLISSFLFPPSEPALGLVLTASHLSYCISSIWPPCLTTRCHGGGDGLVAKSDPTLATPRTVAHQVPLSVGFPRREYWSRLPFPSPGDLPNSGIKPRSLALQVDSLLT